ncbi:MAG: hypothetical protein C0404_11330 [Verrucomicrobia bacterium]|nr:hypothetical protein [Verrucomicrobiota bacterium]
MRRSEKNRGSRRFVVALLVVALLVVLWVSGLIGRLFTCHLLPALLPMKIGDEFTAISLKYNTPAPKCEKGIMLTIGTSQLRTALKGSLPGTWWMLPRGIIRDRILLEGRWMPRGVKMPRNEGIPVYLAVDDSAGPHPQLVGRYHASALNAILKDEEAFNLRQTEDWVLGQYELVYQIFFDTLTVTSDDEVDAAPIAHRQLKFFATGNVNLKFNDLFLSASATARVSPFNGAFDLRFSRDDDGVIVQYDARIDSLKADVNNLAPWADEKISKELRKSLLKSLNRKKKKDRLAEDRFPSWIPLDVKVDIRIVPEDMPVPLTNAVHNATL